MATKPKGGLGRGLDALFADQAPIVKEEKTATTKTPDTKKPSENSVVYLDLHTIKPNSNQPRKTFDQEKLQELANSIVEHGIIQPIIVRKSGEFYEIVAGERRWRAARIASLKEIPCIIRNFTDEENMLVAIIENMQREDLNPIEEAEGVQQMVYTYGLTQEQVAKSLGKSRPYITNTMRLLKLSPEVMEYIKAGQLSAGHGRTLVTIEDKDLQKQLANKIIDEKLSVRETEAIVSSLGVSKESKSNPANINKPQFDLIEQRLKEIIGTKIAIKGNEAKGRIEISYHSKEELERLIELMEKTKG